MTLNKVKMKLPTSVTISLKDKLKFSNSSFSYLLKTRYEMVSFDVGGC